VTGDINVVLTIKSPQSVKRTGEGKGRHERSRVVQRICITFRGRRGKAFIRVAEVGKKLRAEESVEVSSYIYR
jgi:hypothetical protein